ncbi:MAG TPA: phosphatidate cytidylyltransferase [Actinomycetota bacterium]|nr:phosphatidate cytidylyltransferase [Actinomycetota bacterium]
MAEDDKDDELFEDLDKFFAPIQDVDWPETEPPPSRATTATGSPPSGSSERPPAEDDLDEDEDEPEDDEELEVEEEAELLAEDDEELDEEEEEELEEEEEDDLSVEAFTQPPAEYVELPAPEEEGAVAELDEGAALERPPSEEEVEAAAEHFASSVRDEVELEPRASEEVDEGIAGLLGTEGEEEEELGLEEPAPVRTVRVGTEGLGGPSWQEPTVVEVGPDHERRPGARDLPLAFLTGLALAALAIGAIAIGAGVFAVFAGIVVLVAQGELYLALQKRHHQPATALGLVAGALILGAGYYRREDAMLAVFVLSAFATFLWFLATPEQHRRGVLSNIALTILGIAYVPLLAGYVLSALSLPDGRGIVLSIIGLTVVYDTAAFVFGTWWGSKPLAPATSPKKSVEGLVAATLATILVAIAVVPSAASVLDTLGRAAALGVAVAIFAPLGDLAESLLKRDLDLKDIGSILPGHGGVLDRIDSLLFVGPAAFLLLRLLLS